MTANDMKANLNTLRPVVQQPQPAEVAKTATATAAEGACAEQVEINQKRDLFTNQLAELVGAQTGRSVCEVLTSKTFKATLDQMVKQNDISMAQMIVSDRRKSLSEADVAASHAKVASMSLNDVLRMSPRERAEMTVDALKIGGAQKALVMKAIDLVLDGEPVNSEIMEPIGGTTRQTTDTHRTQMAVTDEGHFHVLMTAVDRKMTDGAWVHLERTNRVDAEGMASREASPYAAPPAWAVRLMSFFMGTDAPRTAFFGLPNRIANASGEKLPAGANDTASAAVSHNRETLVRHAANMGENLFRWAVSEMKVQVDGMSPDETVDAMRELVDEVQPKEGQYFSAAFNMYRAAVDFGMANDTTVSLSREQMAKISMQAIETAAAGGWGKLTLDSSRPDPSQPSEPLIEEFGSRNLFEFIHKGHTTQPRGLKQGFEQYVSGGMQPYHFPLLAMTGVDGVGVGGAIHKRTEMSGIMGALEPEKVRDALSRRDKNDMAPPGQVTYLLRRLDAREGQGERLTDIDRSLQSRALNLLRPFFDRVDAKMDGLKATRNAEIADAKQKKDAGTLDDAGYQAALSKARGDFAKAFEAAIDSELQEPGFVGHCNALIELAKNHGYPPRETPTQA